MGQAVYSAHRPGGGGSGSADLAALAVAGHPHLAAWAASRHVLPAGAPGSAPVVRPVVAFPQAGVLDLVSCADEGVGGSACPDLLGAGPNEAPEAYAVASPLALVPIGGNFTMDPADAAWAVNELIKPATVLPSHANEPATEGGKVRDGSKTATFLGLVKAAAHVPLSGKTMEFDGAGKCVGGC